jgi:GcrA cell cycle regulator
MSTATWTPERIEQLRTHVINGLTCSQIAAEIGVTRNAVIGKIHRLGLTPVRPPGAPARLHPPRERRSRLWPLRSRPRRSGAEGPLVQDGPYGAPQVESIRPCSLLDLAQGKCRWPIGGPESGNFAFCGNEAVSGLSYCAGHSRMAYRYGARRSA